MFLFSATAIVTAADQPQYEHGDISIAKAVADEPKLDKLSVPLAVEYLEKGTVARNGQRKCVTCHTNGTYMIVRPALSTKLRKPSEATHDFFLSVLKTSLTEDRAKLKQSTRPAQVIYLAAGLAEWDAHVTKQLSQETEQALSLLFEIQLETGTWGTLDCWPPYESDAFHEATVTAMVVATAPGWLKKITDSKDEKLLGAVEKLKNYLRTETPPHNYSRTLLLWANSRMPGWVDDARKQELITMLLQQQRQDGGWSIRADSNADPPNQSPATPRQSLRTSARSMLVWQINPASSSGANLMPRRGVAVRVVYQTTDLVGRATGEWQIAVMPSIGATPSVLPAIPALQLLRGCWSFGRPIAARVDRHRQ